MNVLVAYDVNTQTKAGESRLRKVARACKGFGQRVQFSVFECSLSEADFERLRSRLLKIIHIEEDSLRIYMLYGRREEVVEVHGRDLYVDFRDPLIV